MIEDNYVVIGGGSTGTSIAYYLSKKGKKVTLIERGKIASGNTGKSSALVRTHYSNPLIASMSIYSQGILSHFDEIGYSGFTRTGMLFPFGNDYGELARENVRMLKMLGAREEELGTEDLLRYFPDINTEGIEYLVFEPDSGYADPVVTANSFASKASELGANVVRGKEVLRIDSDRQGVSVEVAGGELLRFKKAILATNVWTNELLSRSGVSGDRLPPIKPSLHSIIYLKRGSSSIGPKPTLWDPLHLSYYKMEGKTLTAIGSLDPKIDTQYIDLNSPIPENASEEYIEDYLSRIIERLPSMGEASLVSTYNGLYDMTPDGQAIIDELTGLGLENVYICAGLSGHGFKLSPAYGLIVSEMVSDTAVVDAHFDWRPFNIDRFKTGKLIGSKYTDIGTIY